MHHRLFALVVLVIVFAGCGGNGEPEVLEVKSEAPKEEPEVSEVKPEAPKEEPEVSKEEVQTAESSIPTRGMVSHWSFDEGSGNITKDSAGNNPGIIIGASWVKGVKGGALSFDGKSSVVSLGNPSNLNFTGQITIAAWIRPLATIALPGISRFRDSENVNIVSHGYSHNPLAAVFLKIKDRKYHIGSWDGNEYFANAPIPSVDIGAWVHLAGVYDGTKWILFRNGIQISSQLIKIGAISVDAPWAIGAHFGGRRRNFKGSIDEVYIYNRGLSADEVKKLAGLLGKQPDKTAAAVNTPEKKIENVRRKSTAGEVVLAPSKQTVDPKTQREIGALIEQLNGKDANRRSNAVLALTKIKEISGLDNAELHVVSAYGGVRQPDSTRGVVEVIVNRSDTPIVLTLCAYESTKWNVKVQPGAKLKAVIVGGYARQKVNGIDDDIPMVYRTSAGGHRDYFYASSKNTLKYVKMVKILLNLTGLEITSFHSSQGSQVTPVVISPGSKKKKGYETSDEVSKKLVNLDEIFERVHAIRVQGGRKKDPVLSALVQKVVANFKKASGKKTLLLSVPLDRMPLSVSKEGKVSYLRNGILLVDGSANVSHANDSLIIARDDVHISHGARNIVIAGQYIDVSHDGSTSAGRSTPPSELKDGSLLISGAVVSVSHGYGTVCSAPGYATFGHATGVTFINSNAKFGNRGGCRQIVDQNAMFLRKVKNHPLEKKIKLLKVDRVVAHFQLVSTGETFTARPGERITDQKDSVIKELAGWEVRYALQGSSGPFVLLSNDKDSVRFGGFQFPTTDKKAEKTKPSNAQIQQWVKHLGDDNFKVREEATRNLINAGRAAFDAVTEVTISDDVEVKQRASMIIDQIGKQLNKEAIAYFKKLRGRVTLDKKSPGERVIGLSIGNGYSNVTDAGLVHLKGLTNLNTLYLNGTSITDTGLVHLKGLTNLKELRLGYTKVTDAGLEHLKGLARLQILYLGGTNVTDTGLVHLKGLTSLQELRLGSTKITGAGLLHLKGLTELQELNLTHTNITDAGLVHLKGLTNLRRLDLRKTNVTDAGLVHLTGLTNLQRMVLTETEITDAGLVHLKGLTRLRSLILYKTKATRSGIEKLHRELPRCIIQLP